MSYTVKGADSSQHRMKTLRQLYERDGVSCESDLTKLLGDTSDADYPVFRGAAGNKDRSQVATCAVCTYYTLLQHTAEVTFISACLA